MANSPPRDHDERFAQFLESLEKSAMHPSRLSRSPSVQSRSCSLADLWRVMVLASEDLVPRFAPLVVWRRLSPKDTQRVTRDAAVLLADVSSGEALWTSLERLLSGREADRTALYEVQESLRHATRELQRVRRERR